MDQDSGLCAQTCHRGLTKNLELELLASIGVPPFPEADVVKRTYFEGVERYRQYVSDSLREVE